MFTILFIFAVGFLYHFYQRYRRRSLPPYSDGALPILGHSIIFLTTKNLFSFLSRTVDNSLKRRMELVTLRLGIWDIHLIINPEDAYLIANSCLEKDTIYNFGKPFLGEGLLTAPGKISNKSNQYFAISRTGDLAMYEWNEASEDPRCTRNLGQGVVGKKYWVPKVVKKYKSYAIILSGVSYERALFVNSKIVLISKWKVHRKLLNPTFHQQVLDGYLHEFNNQTRDLLDAVAVHAGRGPFDHTEHMAQTILHIICATAMGSSKDKEEMQVRKMFLEVFERFLHAVTERVQKFWLHSDLVFYLTGRKKQTEILTDKMKVFSKTILDKKRIEIQMNRKQISDLDSSPKTRLKPFIELLLELSEDGSLTDLEITDELNTFIAAGTDTMAVTMSNALTCIGSYSAVQERIFEELQEVFEGSDRDVEKQDLPKLKYLEAVIRETLRVHPPVPFIGRILDKEIKIKDYTLPAGSKCYIAVYGVLRHWSWGPDAHQFRPERWLDGSLPDNIKGFAAFGIGKRSCIGYNFAIMGLKTIIANFLRRYSIESDVRKMVQEFYMTTKPISGHEISIEKRQHNTDRRE